MSSFHRRWVLLKPQRAGRNPTYFWVPQWTTSWITACSTFRQASAKLHQPEFCPSNPLLLVQKTKKKSPICTGTNNEGHDAAGERDRLTPSSGWTPSTRCAPDHATFTFKCDIFQDQYFRVIKTIIEPFTAGSRTISAANEPELRKCTSLTLGLVCWNRFSKCFL